MSEMYGNYTYCLEEDVPELKALLLNEMMEMIRLLAERDDFWEITKNPHDEERCRVRVAYKICIPQINKGNIPCYCPNLGTDARWPENV